MPLLCKKECVSLPSLSLSDHKFYTYQCHADSIEVPCCMRYVVFPILNWEHSLCAMFSLVHACLSVSLHVFALLKFQLEVVLFSCGLFFVGFTDFRYVICMYAYSKQQRCCCNIPKMLQICTRAYKALPENLAQGEKHFNNRYFINCYCIPIVSVSILCTEHKLKAFLVEMCTAAIVFHESISATI